MDIINKCLIKLVQTHWDTVLVVGNPALLIKWCTALKWNRVPRITSCVLSPAYLLDVAVCHHVPEL